MRYFILLILISSLLYCTQGHILFPEEIVSFLSFVYSILPPFKLGKDSRFGAGFRIGPNADFQVLVELGPQSETQPLGPNANSAREIRAYRMSELKSGKINPRKRFKGKKKKVLASIPNKNLTEQSTR